MYVGRFAPTPSGPLHFGSIVTAIGSYCDAKFNGGRWIIRIDDLDEERNIDGADTDILRTLESLGLQWDTHPIYQSQQKKYYGEWRHALSKKDDVYPCSCSRKILREHSVFKDGDWIYSGHCKLHFTENQTIRNHRFNLRQPCTISINDIGQGLIAEDLCVTSGDFVVFKADGTPSYHLASVLDDHSEWSSLGYLTPNENYTRRLPVEHLMGPVISQDQRVNYQSQKKRSPFVSRRGDI